MIRSLKNKPTIEFYEWAAECKSLSDSDVQNVIANKRAHKIRDGDTLLSTICDKIKMAADRIVIITDGAIVPSEFDRSAAKLKSLTSSTRQEPPQIRFVICADSDVNDSILLALGSSGMPVEYVVNDEDTKNLPRALVNNDLLAYIADIDIDKYTKDNNYKKETDSKLRISTVGCSDVSFLSKLKAEIDRLERSDPTETYCDLKDIVVKFSDIAKQSNNSLELQKGMLREQREDIRKEFENAIKSPEPTEDMKRRSAGIQQLHTIVDNCRDKTKLYFEQTSTVTAKLPAPIIVDNENDDHDAALIDSKYIECQITYQTGVPYLVFYPPASTVSKSYLKQVVQNPLLVTSLFNLSTSIGAFFVNDPELFTQKIDPRTRQSFAINGFTLVMPLGDSPEHIKYTNQVMNKSLFNNYSVADPDLMFMAIWHYLKYETQEDFYAKTLAPCFEVQLRARFEKRCPLSLSSSIYEKSNVFAEKWVCVWYLVHELPFIYGNRAPDHSATQRFLSRIDIFIAFLRDVYEVEVEKSVVDYLHQFSRIKQLIRNHNVADKDEFWRRIRALKTEAWYVDSSGSVVSMGKDLIVSLNKDEVNFNKGSVKVDTVEENRKATKITIPLDEERKSPFPDFFVSMFPKGIAPAPNVCANDDRRIDRLAELSLHIPCRNSTFKTFLFFEQEDMNEKLRLQKIAELGFDPRTFSPYWDPVTSDVVTPINTSTLRPESFVDGRAWTVCAEEVFGSARFISFYNLWIEFVSTFKKIPSLEDFALFIYKKETRKTHHVYLKDGVLETIPIGFQADPCNTSLAQMRKPCFTMYSNFAELCRNVLHQFDTIVKDLSIDYCIAVQKLSVKKAARVIMEALDVLEYKKKILEDQIPSENEVASMCDLGMLQALAKLCDEKQGNNNFIVLREACFKRMHTVLREKSIKKAKGS